jgi:hypothetical protein
VYRLLFPDVDVRPITCAPSRSQYRWRSRWSAIYRRWWRNEDEADKAYRAEQECGCTTFGDDETPAVEALEGQLALGPGEPQGSLTDLTDAITRPEERERVRRRKR